jgi:hypothetical protein
VTELVRIREGRSVMEYRLEELLPAAAGLTEKYTSKESSSVTYETAQMLMEAVIYCIGLCEESYGGALRSKRGLRAEEAYSIGYEKVIEKTYEAKAVYDRLAMDFEDYGCVNYRDTMVSGMPQFFLRYDARFCPQDHILTLDYPTMNRYGKKGGIRLIYEYLCDAEREQRLLRCFDSRIITALLRHVEAKQDVDYMENICSLVLLQSLGCLISKKQLTDLTLTRTDTEEVRRYFSDDPAETIGDKVQEMIGLIIQRAGMEPWKQYFQREGNEFAVRIYNAMKYDALDALFYV